MPQPREHRYTARTTWIGETRDPKRYSRDHVIDVPGKPPLPGSADASLGGNGDVHNPEDLMVSALSTCHMLWYLHLCAVKGVVVTRYEDEAHGRMIEEPGAGRFTEVTLNPIVTIAADSDAALAEKLHERAHSECFIANSVNFPVSCVPTIHKTEA